MDLLFDDLSVWESLPVDGVDEELVHVSDLQLVALEVVVGVTLVSWVREWTPRGHFFLISTDLVDSLVAVVGENVLVDHDFFDDSLLAETPLPLVAVLVPESVLAHDFGAVVDEDLEIVPLVQGNTGLVSCEDGKWRLFDSDWLFPVEVLHL